MKVFSHLTSEIPGTNVHSFNLIEFSKFDSNTALYYGYDFLENPKLSEYNRSVHSRNVYLNMYSPTQFCSHNSINEDDIFDEVYSICPYSNSWLNTIKNTKKYKDIFYPFNKNDIPAPVIKKYDVIYHGGLHSYEYVKLLEAISKFNYRYTSQNFGINNLTAVHLNKATNINLTNKEKLSLISECKISVCLNTFPVQNHTHIINVTSRKDWELNTAFQGIYTHGIAPQFKSRFNEAAFCKTLNLVQRDPWDLAERYYDKDEFVYFNTMEELPDKISEILRWPKERYQEMTEKAFKKSLNYTTENLYNKIKNG